MKTYPRLVSWSYNSGKSIFSSKSEKESLTKIYITSKEGEDILEGGVVACLNRSGFSSSIKDPYFNLVKEIGFTSSARKHRDLLYNMREAYPDLECKLKPIESKVKDYNEYVYLDVSHIDNYVNPLTKDDDRFLSINFIKKEHFNEDFIVELNDYKPRALLDYQVIKRYEEIIVPEVMADIKKEFPELYKAALLKSEDLQETDEKVTFVGKKAKVLTLNPGKVSVIMSYSETEVFSWDGDVMSNDKILKNKYGRAKVSQTIKPDEDMIVMVYEDSTVNEKTEFVD